jgi:ABC-2 type transport system permease protein
MIKLMHIALKEWKTFFYTPFGMIIIPLYTILCSSYFFSSLSSYMDLSTPGKIVKTVHGLNVTEHLLRPFFGNVFNVFLFIIPIITMRSFSEEKKHGNFELMLSYPVKPFCILLGKYLGLLSIILLLLGITSIYPLIVDMNGSPHIPEILSVFLGLGLFIMLYVAIGITASLFTENQFVAAVIAYAIIFVSFLIRYIAFSLPEPFDLYVASLLVIAHFESFKRGMVHMSDIFVYMSLTGICLCLAYQKLLRHYKR